MKRRNRKKRAKLSMRKFRAKVHGGFLKKDKRIQDVERRLLKAIKDAPMGGGNLWSNPKVKKLLKKSDELYGIR